MKNPYYEPDERRQDIETILTLSPGVATYPLNNQAPGCRYSNQQR
jgi:hypothetical protein